MISTLVPVPAQVVNLRTIELLDQQKNVRVVRSIQNSRHIAQLLFLRKAAQAVRAHHISPPEGESPANPPHMLLSQPDFELLFGD